jgi:hypothetical protein
MSVCTKCGQSNVWCPIAYPAYCNESKAWKKNPKADPVFLYCCVCLFRIVYKGRADGSACQCEKVAHTPVSKRN